MLPIVLAGVAVALPVAAEEGPGVPAAETFGFTRPPADAGTPFATPSRDLVRAVQIALRVAGHDPGPADGLIGPKTRAAIREFQRRNEMAPHGAIDDALIAALVAALDMPARSPQPLPANAHRIPFLSAWACDAGYRRAGDRCEAAGVPAHATANLLGTGWACDRGYRRIGQRCEAVDVPRDATPENLGDDWSCDRGYRRVGNQCDRIPAPANATRDRYGAGWSCDRGFRRVGSVCVRESLKPRAFTCCGVRPRP
ncbi:MAG: peptidoglycan-binding protein [Rhodospirillales bacterium]|nr:MAG: peptidoglycan-binding protein [Rhodospirillales bacterium]